MRTVAAVLAFALVAGVHAQAPKSGGNKTAKPKPKPKPPAVKLPAKTAALKPEVSVDDKGKFGLIFGKDAVVTNDVMKEMAGLKNLLGFVVENGGGIDDAGAAAFKDNKRLETFIVRRSKMTSKCMDSIATMTGLEQLQLSEISLDAAAIKKIAALPKLADLALNNTEIGDEAAEGLATSKTIVFLNLSNTGVHGRTLKQLAKMKQLKTLGITDNRLIRKDQLDALKKALPGLNVPAKAPLLGLRLVKKTTPPAAN